MSLFQKGNFILASGLQSNFKIDCDALTDSDLDCIAHLLHQKLYYVPFSKVMGVPTGGERLAKAMEKYIIPTAHNWLIVDDVWTTGISMKNFIDKHVPKNAEGRWEVGYAGAVIFARQPTPDWVGALFTMNPLYDDAIGTERIAGILPT